MNTIKCISMCLYFAQSCRCPSVCVCVDRKFYLLHSVRNHFPFGHTCGWARVEYISGKHKNMLQSSEFIFQLLLLFANHFRAGWCQSSCVRSLRKKWRRCGASNLITIKLLYNETINFCRWRFLNCIPLLRFKLRVCVGGGVCFVCCVCVASFNFFASN